MGVWQRFVPYAELGIKPIWRKGESFPLVNGDDTCEFESPEIAAIER
jgi:hypothetical protein